MGFRLAVKVGFWEKSSKEYGYGDNLELAYKLCCGWLGFGNPLKLLYLVFQQ